MVYIEKIKRGKVIYYYVSKNFRISINKWKKIRKYAGKKPPTKEVIKEIAKEIEKKAQKLGVKRPENKYLYLTDAESEVLEDIKQAYKKWKKTLPLESVEKFENDFLVRFTYNSNAIEGNTLSMRDTYLILQENIIPQDATTYEYNEVANTRECMEFIKKYKGNLNKSFVLKVHRFLTKNTAVQIVGRYRNHDVIIGGAEHIPPPYKEVNELMQKFFIWFNNSKKRLHPLELACLVHTKFVRVHPFSDGNGRTARILSNFILNKAGCPMFIVENKERRKYYSALEKTDKGNEKAFIKFIFNIIVTKLKR